jgi:hypothetical protein
VTLERPGAGDLLDAAAAIRLEIRQPLPSTDVADVMRIRALVNSDREVDRKASRSADALHAAASNAVREITRSPRS